MRFVSKRYILKQKYHPITSEAKKTANSYDLVCTLQLWVQRKGSCLNHFMRLREKYPNYALKNGSRRGGLKLTRIISRLLFIIPCCMEILLLPLSYGQQQSMQQLQQHAGDQSQQQCGAVSPVMSDDQVQSFLQFFQQINKLPSPLFQHSGVPMGMSGDQTALGFTDACLQAI